MCGRSKAGSRTRVLERRAKRVVREPETAGGPVPSLLCQQVLEDLDGQIAWRNEDAERNLHHLMGHGLAQYYTQYATK